MTKDKILIKLEKDGHCSGIMCSDCIFNKCHRYNTSCFIIEKSMESQYLSDTLKKFIKHLKLELFLDISND